MPVDKQLDLWPESTGGDKDKRLSAEGLREDAAREEAPELAEENNKFKPDADGILKRLRETPESSPEEVARKQMEYAKRVYPDQPIESVDKAAEHAEIEKIRANLKTMLNPKLKINQPKPEANQLNPRRRNSGAFKQNDENDAWHDINPPSMFNNNFREYHSLRPKPKK